MKLDVLMVTPYFPPIIKGPSVYVYNLAKELANQGVRVRVHTIRYNSSVHTCSGKALNFDSSYIEVSYFKSLFDLRGSSYDQPISPSYVYSTIKASNDFDIIHIHDFPKICNDVLISLLRKVNPLKPVILTPHGVGFPLPASKFSSKVYWSLGFPLKTLFSVHHVIAVSPLQAKLFNAICKGCVSLIPEAIPTHYFVSAPSFTDDGRLKVLFIGRMVEEKGIKDLIYAIREVAKKTSGRVELRCIGPDYGYLQKAIRIINELKLNDVVKILGSLPEDEKIKNLDWCDVLVLPSYYEAFGLPLLEAMARGKPVVATKTVGGMSLVRHGETGFLVEIGDWRGIANMLLHFSSNPELKYQMGRESLKYALQFSMQKMVEKHIELYQNLAFSSSEPINYLLQEEKERRSCPTKKCR